VSTIASDVLAAKFESVLASDEKDRAARFILERRRHSFVVARGVLRCLLGRYLDMHPANIRFNYGSKGKPAVTSTLGIEFNATHSGELAVFAFTAGCPIGVDLEQIRPLSDIQDIADRFFCSEEAAELMALPPTEREHAFFRCWTRKEAYIKAIGEGLSAPLDEFRVTLQPTEPARFVHISRDTAEAWTLHDLGLASGYAAALAYRDRERSLSVFPIEDSLTVMGQQNPKT
jgi:4'-phosphopantetheinyl transferase